MGDDTRAHHALPITQIKGAKCSNNNHDVMKLSCLSGMFSKSSQEKLYSN